MTDLPYDAAEAARAVADADPGLAETVARVGPLTITLRTDETLPALVRAVTGQQLSVKAAATIHERVLDAFAPGGHLDAQALLDAPDEAVRACGLSRAKTAAVRDLAARHLDGTLPSRADLLAMPDGDVVRALTAVRGVGVWTAQMMMIFNLGRPDVWPVADLGVQEGVRLARGLDHRPKAREMGPLGEPYAPWRSVAAWYCWRAVHFARHGGP